MERVFIVNPAAGKKGSLDALKRAIGANFPSSQIVLTQAPGHAQELAKEAAGYNFPQVIVAGGDGTVNEVIQSLAGTQTALGIIPNGSGNGLARQLGYPMDDFDAACKYISTLRDLPSDLGMIGKEYFINVAGLGFEAEIAAEFARRGAAQAANNPKAAKRGSFEYFKIGMGLFFNYSPAYTEISFDDGRRLSGYPFTLSIANGCQYGSNFMAAPQAKLNDGLLDIAMTEGSTLKLLGALPNFFLPGISPVNATKTLQVKQASINCFSSFVYHIDGEVRQASDKIDIKACPGAIRLLVK